MYCNKCGKQNSENSDFRTDLKKGSKTKSKVRLISTYFAIIGVISVLTMSLTGCSGDGSGNTEANQQNSNSASETNTSNNSSTHGYQAYDEGKVAVPIYTGGEHSFDMPTRMQSYGIKYNDLLIDCQGQIISQGSTLEDALSSCLSNTLLISSGIGTAGSSNPDRIEVNSSSKVDINGWSALKSNITVYYKNNLTSDGVLYTFIDDYSEPAAYWFCVIDDVYHGKTVDMATKEELANKIAHTFKRVEN